MEIGVSTASLFMRCYNEDALPLLDALDARVVEVFLESFSEYTREYAALLKNRKGGLKVHSVHTVTMNFETELFSKNDRAYADAFTFFEGVLETAKTLGAGNYTMHGKARIKKSPLYDEYPFIGRRFEELCSAASEKGVSLCLENVSWAYYNRPGYFTEIKKYAPSLKATLDVKQARISGFDYREYLDEMGESIGTVHLSDVDDNGKIRLPGRGNFDFEELLKRLKDVGFDGACLIEVYKDDYGDVAEIRQSADYLRELVYKIF